MDAQPNSVGRLAHLTDDEILDRFDRIWKSLFHYEEQWSFRSSCYSVPRSFGLSLKSPPLCLGRLSTQS